MSWLLLCAKCWEANLFIIKHYYYNMLLNILIFLQKICYCPQRRGSTLCTLGHKQPGNGFIIWSSSCKNHIVVKMENDIIIKMTVPMFNWFRLCLHRLDEKVNYINQTSQTKQNQSVSGYQLVASLPCLNCMHSFQNWLGRICHWIHSGSRTLGSGVSVICAEWHAFQLAFLWHNNKVLGVLKFLTIR